MAIRLEIENIHIPKWYDFLSTSHFDQEYYNRYFFVLLSFSLNVTQLISQQISLIVVTAFNYDWLTRKKNHDFFQPFLEKQPPFIYSLAKVLLISKMNLSLIHEEIFKNLLLESFKKY